MEGVQKSWIDRANPGRIADAANRQFVELGRFLLNLTTGQYHESTRCDDARPRPTRPVAPPDGTGARFFSTLAEQIDRIVRRSGRAGREVVASRFRTASEAPADEVVRRWLKQLFHEDSRRRMAAVRWVREHGHREAIPTLEGVLSIEEDGDVRAEILCTLRELGAVTRPEKGEVKCSRSSAV